MHSLVAIDPTGRYRRRSRIPRQPRRAGAPSAWNIARLFVLGWLQPTMPAICPIFPIAKFDVHAELEPTIRRTRKYTSIYLGSHERTRCSFPRNEPERPPVVETIRAISAPA